MVATQMVPCNSKLAWLHLMYMATAAPAPAAAKATLSRPLHLLAQTKLMPHWSPNQAKDTTRQHRPPGCLFALHSKPCTVMAMNNNVL